MIDWVGYGWMAGAVTGPNDYFADLTLEVPRGDVVASVAVTGFRVGDYEGEPGSVAAYIREYGHFVEGVRAVAQPTPAGTNNILAIEDCFWVRFRLTVFQATAFAQGQVLRHAPVPPAAKTPKATVPKVSIRDYQMSVGGRNAGMHRVMALGRASRLPVDEILDRSAEEAAKALGVRRRSVETKPIRRSRGIEQKAAKRLVL